MSGIYTYRNFAYLDTNILSHLAKKLQNKDWSQVWKLRDYLLEQDLTIAVSEAHMLELSDAYRLHEPLAILLVTLPSALIKSREMIFREEVESHPFLRSKSLVAQPINPVLLEPNGMATLQENLFSKGYVTKARSEQLSQAKQLSQEHSKLKSNFPTSKHGKYVKEQAVLFANVMTIEALQGLHREFLLQFEDDVSSLRLENFRGARLHAVAIFYKFYLGRREPKTTSELGDFGHLYYLPYCRLAIMENDLCNILNQVQKNQKIITETKVEKISFLRSILEN